MAWNDRPHMFALKGTAGTTLAKLGAIRDTVLSSAGTAGVVAQEDVRILGAWVGSQFLTKAQFDAPSLLRVAYAKLRPITAGAAGSVRPGDNPNVVSLLDAPLAIKANEILTVQALASAADVTRALVIIGGKIEAPPQGSGFWVRYTATTAAVSDTWTVLDITLDALPTGTYAVVGHEHWSATCVGARLIFPGQVARSGSRAARVLRTAARTRCFTRAGWACWAPLQRSPRWVSRCWRPRPMPATKGTCASSNCRAKK